jgi:hypothetical protein
MQPKYEEQFGMYHGLDCPGPFDEKLPRMKVYLAGPMRGIPNFNFPAFDFAAEKLRAQGYEVFSPADHDRELHGEAIENNPTGNERECEAKFGFTIRKALGADLRWICYHADAVALLPGWEKSTGATAERAVGIALGLTIIHLGKEYVNV